MALRRTWRNPWLWPTTQLLVLLFPLVVAWRLELDLRSNADAQFAAELMVQFIRPWATAVALALGLGGRWFLPRGATDDPATILRAVSPRMLAVLLVVPVSLAIVQPLSPEALTGPWRELGLLMATLVVPAWAGSLFARLRGFGVVASLGLVALWLGVVFGGTQLFCRLGHLDQDALQMAVAASGVVGSIGLFLAATERVVAPLPRVFVGVGLLAWACSGAMIGWVQSPSLDVVWVHEIVASGGPGGRPVVLVKEPNLAMRLVEVDVVSGQPEPLGYNVRLVGAAADLRIEARVSLDVGLQKSVRLCGKNAEGERCVGARLQDDSPLLAFHGVLPVVLLKARHGLLVWDLATDAAWQVRRPDEVVRWPCFDQQQGIIWRIQTSAGPYRHERLALEDLPRPSDRAEPLDASRAVSSIPIDHGFRCTSGPERAATFISSRRLIGRKNTLFGPGLPPEGAFLGDTVGTTAWSGDGRTFMWQQGPAWARFYREGIGLSEPIRTDEMFTPTLSPNGELLVYATPAGVAYELVVRSVPDGAELLRRPTSSGAASWLGPKTLGRVEDGVLWAIDVATGAERVLFPTPQ